MSKQNDQWKDKLTPEQYRVLREKGTEAPYSGEKLDEDYEGNYSCVACGNQLFDAKKVANDDISSLNGWPSFNEAIPGSVEYKKDLSHMMVRTEVVCSKCGGHLGHVFNTDDNQKHYCINSVCLQKEEK